MTRWALVEGGVCVNTVEQESEPSVFGVWRQVPANVGPGWRVDDSGVLPPRVLSWSDTDLDQRYLWLDVGPFRDRFGMDWLALSTSEHRLARAACAAWSERKYIDLADERNAQLLGALVAAGLPDAAPEIPGSGPLTPEKVGAILTPRTTERERHIKGLAQPVDD